MWGEWGVKINFINIVANHKNFQLNCGILYWKPCGLLFNYSNGDNKKKLLISRSEFYRVPAYNIIGILFPIKT